MFRCISLYRDTTGLFRQTKYVFLFTALINLFLSVLLGIYFGLSGILYATAISRLLTNVWFEPMMLYKTYFKKSPLNYFVKQILYFLLVIIICGLISVIVTFFDNGTVAAFIEKILLCLFIPNIIFTILFYKTDEFKYIINKVKFLTLVKLKQAR
jgi:peptidoglycan biosynthesis protein MviN/MurJ (putative lipid II flippase)